ncbi:DEKNAAC101062 [Brettanomyces naardenensis]|uniref:DEKNAAC101062 n=1 Tax=Brettanomyces naardenensis TaxID=13370 RepID=A0A448YH27_BRENA|nr:DEKNAAC101062 [Brettanomyces naardenensis]
MAACSRRFIEVKSARSHGRCEECKRRKKKCDERKPSCGSCLRRKVSCVYNEPVIYKPKKAAKATKVKVKAKRHDDPTPVKVSDQNSSPPIFVPEPFSLGADPFQSLASFDMGEDDFLDIKTIIESILRDPNGADEQRSYATPSLPEETGSSTSSSSSSNSTAITTPSSFGNAFQQRLQQLSMISGKKSKGEADMELSARAFLNNFKYFGSDSDKYNRSFSLFLPLAYQNKAVLYAVSGWGMLVLRNGDQLKAVEYLDKSRFLCDEVLDRLQRDPSKIDRLELISLVVCLTCHVLVSSFRGDSAAWKKSFEDLYSTLKWVGLENFFNGVRDSPIGLWVLNCFFYNDVLKVIKVTNDKKVGTLFPLSEYHKIISFNFEDIEHSLEEDDFEGNGYEYDIPRPANTLDLVDPVMGCCISLFFRLAEVNNLYDLFIVKMRNLIDLCRPLMSEMDGKSEDFQIDFVRSPQYRYYEDYRVQFHDWIEIHTDRLTKKINETLPRIAALNRIKDPKERELHLTFFRVLQLALLLFLQIKLKEAPPRSMHVKRLMVHCYRNMRQLIVPNFVNRLAFPLLVTGAAACEIRDRVIIKGMYLEMAAISDSPNLRKVWSMMQEFWEINPMGETWDMTQNIINRLDWNICLI